MSLLHAWIEAEKMIQIVLMLPCGGFIGWLIGLGLDHWLHQSWMAMAGIVVGIISGLVGAIRMAMAYAADAERKGKSEAETKIKGSGDQL